MTDRRAFLKTCLTCAAVPAMAKFSRSSVAANLLESAESAQPLCSLLDGSPDAVAFLASRWGPVLGKLKTKPSREIATSPFSVGLETLDRSLYDPARLYDRLGELGVKWARLQTGWARCEKAPAHYEFNWLDDVVDHVRSLGVRPWFNLGYGNRLYTPNAPDESAVGWVPINSDAAQQAWLRFVRAIAQHFRDRVQHWEIWNEPNIRGFWKPTDPSAKVYTQFAKATSEVIREEIPEAVIIGGALAGMPTDYFRQMLAAGLGEVVQKISYHPYRAVPEASYAKTLQQWRDILNSAGYSRIQLWQGENGCPSVPGGEGALREYPWDEVKQAKWLLRRILYDRLLGVELTSYYHMVDLVNYRGQGKINPKGLLRGTDYSPKPAYFAYQRLCTLFDGQTLRAKERDVGATLVLSAGPPKTPSPNDTGQKTSGSGESSSVIEPAAFLRRDRPLWCFWMPKALVTPSVIESGTVRIAEPYEAGRWCMVDPLSGFVFAIERQTGTSEKQFAVDCVLADYPLIIADRRAVEDVLVLA